MPAPTLLLAEAAMAICWLISYPKSGNTWLRAMLTNYVCAEAGPASINSLVGKTLADDREHFENYLGLDSSEMTASAVERLRPRLQEELANALPSPLFIKTHDAWRRVGPEKDAPSLFSSSASRGVVYMVRNPLDVAVSYAHHHRFGIDDSVRLMNNPQGSEFKLHDGAHVMFEQRLSSWSGNVTSWMEQTELPVHVVRYEDMLADPLAAFSAVVRFAGLPRDEEKLAQSVQNATFERLRSQEERFGFREKHPPALSFFRAGRAGAWRSVLTAAQVEALVAAHGATMLRFGYLEDAQAFLTGASLDGATDACFGHPADVAEGKGKRSSRWFPSG